MRCSRDKKCREEERAASIQVAAERRRTCVDVDPPKNTDCLASHRRLLQCYCK